jgi:hypothetical protein
LVSNNLETIINKIISIFKKTKIKCIVGRYLFLRGTHGGGREGKEQRKRREVKGQMTLYSDTEKG